MNLINHLLRRIIHWNLPISTQIHFGCVFWGFALLSAGTIGEITFDLAHKAARGQMHFVELGKWNRALTGGDIPVAKGNKRKNIEAGKSAASASKLEVINSQNAYK